MQTWLKISLLLCLFGFLKELRPSEPFVTEYLSYPWRNITAEELNKYVWPYGTYSTAAQLIIVLLITDFLRYKPMIIVCGISGIITWSIMVWTTSFEMVLLIQVFFGTYVATEVAYYTYIYAKVDKAHYLKVTSHTRAAILCGKFVSAVSAQILHTSAIMNLRQLHMLTLVGQIAATVWAFFLPSVSSSLYFNRESMTSIASPQTVIDTEISTSKINVAQSTSARNVESHNKCAAAFELMWSHLKTAYTDRNVLLWSFWYAAGMCGHLQVISYVQLLWIHIDNRPEMIWNGAVEACTTLLSASVALLASRLHENALTIKRMLWLIVILSLLQGSCLIVAANTSSRFVSYAGYMGFYIFYTFTITISSSEIAKHLPEDSYGLIFGINTFAALILQTILALSVVTNAFGWNLHIEQQFNVYAYLYVGLGVTYLVPLAWNRLSSGNSSENMSQKIVC